MAGRYQQADVRDVLGHEAEPAPPEDATAREFFEAMKLRASGAIQLESFRTWWTPAVGRAWEDEGRRIVIAVPSVQFVLWWRALYMGWLATFARECGRQGLEFRFVVVPSVEPTLHGGSIR